MVTPAAHHSGVVTQFNSKETISSQRPGRWVVALNSPSLSRSNLFLPFSVFVFSAFSSLLHLWWPCWRTIHWVWLAMPVICISYFVILRPPGNSHPGTGPAHYKYLRPPFNVTLPPNSLLLPLHFMSPASFSLFRCFQILEIDIASTELASLLLDH